MQVRLHGPSGELPITEGISLLGRGHDCRLHLADPRLSRHHARFILASHELRVEDCGSTNGVLVNSQRITASTVLASGDVIVCGPCVFTVAIDATLIEERVHEPTPASGARVAGSTETMDPVVVDDAALRAHHQAGGTAATPGASTKGTRLDPRIARAVGASGDGGPGLDPDDEADHQTSALDSNRKGRGGAPAAHPPDPPPAPERRKDKTTGLLPADFSARESAALQAQTVVDDPALRATPRERALAGLLDGLQLVLFAAVLGLPPLLSGYGWALVHAGAVLEDGLPVINPHPAGTADLGSLVGSLLHPGGPTRALALIGQLRDQSDHGPLLLLFAGATLALLAALMVVAIGGVAATVLHGSPWWHRRLNLEIVESATGYHLTWLRACARWTLLLLFLPVTLMFVACGVRGPHDLIAGALVRRRKR